MRLSSVGPSAQWPDAATNSIAQLPGQAGGTGGADNPQPQGKMNYQVWEKSVLPQIRADAVWDQEGYRLALFVADVGWHDASELTKHRRTIKLGSELLESLGGVAAGLALACDRKADGAQTLAREDALACARAGCGWYFQARHVLGQEIIMHRVRLLGHIMALLKAAGAGSRLQGPPPGKDEVALSSEKLEQLLQQVPLP